jgi:2-phosphosulfolactate phosphatase
VSEPQRPLRVWIELGAQGAGRGAERGDVVVIVDALRASVTISAALRAGARKVIPVLTVQEAERYLPDPGYRVAGERGGAKLSHLHYGNSPTEIWAHRDEVEGRTLVLTTSNGTRCVNAALGGAAAVLAGSTINAQVVARAVVAQAGRAGCGATLVAAGLNEEPAAEDTFSAALIAGRLAHLGAVQVDSALGEPVPCAHDADSLVVFLASSSAARLIRLGYQEDVRLCAQVDAWDTVPVYRAGGFVSWQPGGPAGSPRTPVST